MPPTTFNPNDPDVIALSKAIVQRESKGDPNAVGDAGTSHGLGQWQGATWKMQAKDVLGDENAQMTPANQKAVMQVSIAKDKAAGLNPAQIAAKWNSGKTEGWENHVGVTTINGQQIRYDTPQYVKDVTSLYQQYKGQPAQGGEFNPAPFSGAAPGQFDFSGLGAAPQEQPGRFKAGGAAGAVQDVAHGAGKAGLQTALGIGRLGQGIQGLVGKGLDAATGGSLHFADDAKGGIFDPNSQSGQRVRQNLDAKNTGEKVGKGLEFVAELGVPVGKLGAGLKKAPQMVAKIAEVVAPKQTAKQAAEALNRFGGTKGGLFRGGTINLPPSVHKMAETVMEHVPEFKPKGSLVENLGHVKTAVGRLADDLEVKVAQSGKDRIYPVKELGSAITKAIEKADVSIGLKGTQYEKQAVALKDAALQIAREKGGKVSDLLPARKEFDALVDKIYPNLYDREYTPIRNAVRSVRDAMTDFTEKHLPEEVGLKQSYANQTKLIRAGENLAAKAVTGAEKEIGKSGIKGFIERHPLVTGAVAGTTGYQALKQVPLIGGLLP